MKLTQLPIGARFEYEGQIFTKTGPMTAADETGGQRMIPRYAVLKPMDGYTPPPEQEATCTVDEKTVRVAFDAFYGTALRLTDDFAKAELEAARQRFLGVLEK